LSNAFSDFGSVGRKKKKKRKNKIGKLSEARRPGTSE